MHTPLCSTHRFSTSRTLHLFCLSACALATVLLLMHQPLHASPKSITLVSLSDNNHPKPKTRLHRLVAKLTIPALRAVAQSPRWRIQKRNAAAATMRAFQHSLYNRPLGGAGLHTLNALLTQQALQLKQAHSASRPKELYVQFTPSISPLLSNDKRWHGMTVGVTVSMKRGAGIFTL